MIGLLLVFSCLCVSLAYAQGGDIVLPSDSKVGYVVIGILLGCAFVGMVLRIKDVYPFFPRYHTNIPHK
jgi:hypothetical protein